MAFIMLPPFCSWLSSVGCFSFWHYNNTNIGKSKMPKTFAILYLFDIVIYPDTYNWDTIWEGIRKPCIQPSVCRTIFPEERACFSSLSLGNACSFPLPPCHKKHGCRSFMHLRPRFSGDNFRSSAFFYSSALQACCNCASFWWNNSTCAYFR